MNSGISLGGPFPILLPQPFPLHYHLCVVDGLFERVGDGTDQNPADPESRLRFHEATGLTSQFLEGLQHTVRKRVLRHFRRHGLLEPHDAEDMLARDRGGGFSLDASVRIEATDRAGLERLIRYCARPPFALDRLHLVGGRPDQILHILPGPNLAGRTALRLSALEFLDRLPKILPPPRPRHHHSFIPPGVLPRPSSQWAPASRNTIRPPSFFPDDLDQSPEFDPAEPKPIPADHFDQAWGA